MKKTLWPRVTFLMLLIIVILLSSWIVSQRNHNDTLETLKTSEQLLKDQIITLNDAIKNQEDNILNQEDIIVNLNKVIVSQNTWIESLENDIENKYAWQEGYLSRLETKLGIISKYLEQQSTFFEPLVDAQKIIKVKVLDIDSYDLKTHLYLEPTGDTLEDAKYIGEILSEYAFEDLEIHVEEFELDDLELLKVDLREIGTLNEKGYYDGVSWMNGYFQGSSGGMVTYMTLTSAFLQPELNQWYDGVYFLYEGQENTFEHVEGLIGKVIIRE